MIEDSGIEIGPAATPRYPLVRRRTVGHLVSVLSRKHRGRDMLLEAYRTRAVVVGEIHELVVTNQSNCNPGDTVSDVAYIGFFEVLVGSIVALGDSVWANERLLGTVAGFDIVHFPNHLNIVIETDSAQTGAELQLDVGSVIRVDPRPVDS